MTATLKMLGRALLAVTVVAAFAAFAPAVAGASVAKTALINADSVTTEDGITNSKGEPISLEQFAAENAGYTVTVASGAEWEAMSAEQFAHYQVLIVGDPICSGTAESANNSAATWAPVVMSSGGNKALVGTDPEDHYLYGGGGASPTNPSEPATAGAEHLVQDGITYAGGVTGATGIYYDTSCGDPGTDLETLERLTTAGPGSWELSNEPPCGGNVQQIASIEAFNSGPTKLTDGDIEGWECSVHVTFPRFPADWNPLAVATDTSTKPTCGTDPEKEETACGQAYVLVSGVGIVATSPNISLSPTEHSDPEGGTHSVTATVVEEKVEITARKGAKPATTVPLVGRQVKFAISGVNTGVTGTCTYPKGEADPECLTDSNGQVVFTYSDENGPGSDTINASVVIGESVQHATAAETWLAHPPVITLTPTEHSDPVGGTHSVTATVIEEREPAPAAKKGAHSHTFVPAVATQVTFAVSGVNAGAKGTCTTPAGEADPECLTDSNGQVVFTYSDANGAGTDKITGAVVVNDSTHEATATETWIPPHVEEQKAVTAAAVTTPAAGSTGVLAFGAARLASSPPACVASNGYLATVAGKGIASVTFSVDGHKVATVRHANHHGAFAARIKVHSAGRHHLSMHVVFTSAANTKPLTIRRSIARCAARPVITPRFTG